MPSPTLSLKNLSVFFPILVVLGALVDLFNAKLKKKVVVVSKEILQRLESNYLLFTL